MTLRQTLALVAADTRERARLEGKRYGFVSYIKLPLNPPALAVVSYRFQHWLHQSGWTLPAGLLRRLCIVLFTADLGSQAEIGEHFMLLHANCICVDDRARIGRNVYLVHHNTVAPGPCPYGRPGDRVVIEDNVVVGCGARIVGPVTVGHDSFIGAGAVVTASLPECSFHLAGPGESLEPA